MPSISPTTGVSLQEISIEAAVAQHLTDLSAGEHDVVFENAQARERTQILFNHANQVGGMLWAPAILVVALAGDF